MTDEQLDRLSAICEDQFARGLMPAQQMADILGVLADYRRLRELERKRDKARFKLRRLEQAVKQVIYHRDYPHIGRHWFLRERATQNQVDAIGRLLEGEG